MLTAPTIKSLATLIDSATEQAQQLLHLLESEQQALLAEDHDSLESLMEGKLRISQALDAIEIQRQEIMLSAGQDTNNDSMQGYLLANQHNRAFKPLIQSWDNLMDWLKKASDQNHLNGLLLEKQRQHVQRALNILFEQSSSPAVYDASGGTAQPKYTRSVGIA